MVDRHRSRRGRGSGRPLPLDTARERFALLVAGPRPLSIDGHNYVGLPNRPIPLDELQERMLRRRCSKKTRDQVWAHLVLQSRLHGATWTLACAGMALPALAGVVRWLSPRFPGEAFDLHSEVLSGFLGGLATVDVNRPRILVRLRWSAYRSGYAALSEALDAPMPVAGQFRSTPPRAPWGHPDLVLARTVRLSVLTQTEADLIGTTRLEQIPIKDWADSHRMAVAAAYKARQRAERRLVAFLRDQSASADPDDPVATYVTDELTPAATNSRSRRQPRSEADAPRPLTEAATALSKPEADVGLLHRGESTAALCSPTSSEVPPWS